MDGDGRAIRQRRRAQDERCLKLLRQWLSGDDEALSKWMGEPLPSVRGDVPLFLLEKDRTLADLERDVRTKEAEIAALRRKVEVLERAIPQVPA